jgi:hypothetical protein
MLSVEECRKYLKEADYTQKQIEEMRDSLYQLAELLVTEYVKKMGVNKKRRDERTKH